MRPSNLIAAGRKKPKLSRLRLVALIQLLLAGGNLASAKEFFVYFGTYTGGLSQGIYVSRLDADTGKLSAPELAIATPSPCYLAIAPGEKFLYTADSVPKFNGESAGAISAFAIDHHSGHLTLLNRASAGGAGPCHVSVDATGHVLMAANYNVGSVKSFRLNPDGTIGADGSYIQQQGTGPNTNRQAGPHAHAIYVDPSNGFALACDLGADRVVIYRLDATTGMLTRHSTASVPAGGGARHLAFSPDGKFAHVINEMGCTVTTFAWNADTGELTTVETVSALPPGQGAQPPYTAAEILTAGHRVYATIRGHDSITAFAADQQTGRLTFLQNVPDTGKVPRGMGIDPTGRWLIVGNQKTDNAVEYAIDPTTGKLSPTGLELKIGSPVDVKFVGVE